MTVKVINKYKEPNHIYCGRGTALGNPFIMGSEEQRDYVCDLYEDWFYNSVDESNFLDIVYGFADLRTLLPNAPTLMLRDIFRKAVDGDVNLGCFCAPKRCHCDTIKLFIDNKLDELDK